MATKDGNDYRLYIESSTPDTYNIIAGQRSCTKSGNRSVFDKSSKTSTYAFKGVGIKEIGITCEGVLDLPDANGFTRMESLWISGAAEKYRVQLDGSTTVWEAEMKVSKLDVSPPFNGEVTYSIELVLTANPVTDLWA